MEVRCIQKGLYKNISETRKYKVVKEDKRGYYLIENNVGNLVAYEKEIFEIVGEPKMNFNNLMVKYAEE